MLWQVLAKFRYKDPKRKIAFLHIPKCAGSSVNWHFKKQLGSARSRRTVMLNAIDIKMTGKRPDQETLNQAAYVAGHCGWDDLVPLQDTHFRFTVLRDPAARTLSFYDFLRQLPSANRAPFFPVAAAKTLSFEAFCTANDPAIRMFVDNVQARTLASSYIDLDDDLPLDWQRMAHRNLAQLDFVATCENLNADMPKLCQMTGLPVPRAGVERNVRRERSHHLPSLDEARDLLGARIAADNALYKQAMALSEPRT